ncbi:MAG: ComEC/Rec2 family competence protein [Verrucomicrobia bacterium]|nr:ComEC/Rec2 family competence protein [Verrucomicrobiota bacterium]
MGESEIDGVEAWHSIVRIRASETSRGSNFVQAAGEVLVTTPGILGTNYFAGQHVEIFGTLSRPDPPLAEGLFDYQNYLAQRGIYYQLQTKSPGEWQLHDPIATSPPLTDRFLNWSQNTLALGLPGEDEPLRLLWAMTLGWRTAFTGDVGDPFLRAGTMHMFAIDGLRIALLSGMIVTLLRVLRLSRAWCGAIAVPAIWFYTAATGWEPSAIRASVMMTIVLGGWSLKRPGDLMNSLAAAALIILVCEPRQLFEASFQLSFFVMLVIGLMLPPLNQFFDRILRLDPLLPMELASRWKKFGLKLSQIILRDAGLSFAAWMGSIPLSAKYFHLFSPVSTLANIIAVPLGTFALMANLGALICGHWLPWFTEIFNHAAWGFMTAMTWVSEEATQIPGAYFYVPEPSLVTIAIYYGVLIAAFSGWFKTARRIAYGVVILMLIGGAYLWQWQSSRGETDLTVLPLNGGHAVYVDADGRDHDWLINCGNDHAARSTLKDALRAQGVNHIPRLVLAEGAMRNCGGTRSVNNLFGVDELWTSGGRFYSEAYREAVAVFDGTAGRHKFFHYGETVGCWRVLFPETTNTIAKATDSPLVLLGDFHGTKVLLLSDLSRSSQSDLLSLTNNLRADIVIAGLPDTCEPLCNALIAAIQPKVIIIADSERPATRRASAALKQRLEQTKIPVIYTRDSHAVKISTDQHGWRLQAMDGREVEGKN